MKTIQDKIDDACVWLLWPAMLGWIWVMCAV